MDKLTAEEKKAMEPYLQATWEYIAGDAQELLEGLSRRERTECIVELVTDANRPSTCGKMPKEMEDRLYAAHDPSTDRWLKTLFRFD